VVDVDDVEVDELVEELAAVDAFSTATVVPGAIVATSL
jgi:hypothetical protein